MSVRRDDHGAPTPIVDAGAPPDDPLAAGFPMIQIRTGPARAGSVTSSAPYKPKNTPGVPGVLLVSDALDDKLTVLTGGPARTWVSRPRRRHLGRLGESVPAQLPGYRLLKQIGVGARSKISLAVELKTGRNVAVKHVMRNTTDDDPFVAQVETEYEVSSNVSHRYLRSSFFIHRIRKLLQVKEVWLVMEYVDGLHLEEARPNRLNTFLTLFRKVAKGLDAMHEVGYVHTDIKPTNILIAQGGVVKIIDFGQSCRIHHRKERIQGTPDYIAPEQVRRAPLDQRTDVFNLGATMYWALTGKHAPTMIPKKNKFGLPVTVPRRAPHELKRQIPMGISRLVMDCIEVDPTLRPPNMMTVVSRLDTMVHSIFGGKIKTSKNASNNH